MTKAILNGTIIAESNDTVVVEGNHYFPLEAVVTEYLTLNDRTSICPWKGTANYYDITVDGKTSTGAAWYYSEPKDAAAQIKDHVAFWGDVQVS